MTSPTRIIMPGADNTSRQVRWAMGTSVAPKYLGVYGDSLERTLKNGAAFGLPPATVLGTQPVLSPGYMSCVTFPTQGLLLPIQESLNYTIMGVFRATSLTSGKSLAIWGDKSALGTNYNNTQLSINGAGTFINLTQNNTAPSIQTSAVGLQGLLPTNWQMVMESGQSGVGFTGRLLTAGGSSVTTVTNDTNPFIISATSYFTVGTQRVTNPAFAGASDISMLAWWDSVLSTNDQNIAAAFMRKLAAKFGITV